MTEQPEDDAVPDIRVRVSAERVKGGNGTRISEVAECGRHGLENRWMALVVYVLHQQQEGPRSEGPFLDGHTGVSAELSEDVGGERATIWVVAPQQLGGGLERLGITPVVQLDNEIPALVAFAVLTRGGLDEGPCRLHAGIMSRWLHRGEASGDEVLGAIPRDSHERTAGSPSRGPQRGERPPRAARAGDGRPPLRRRCAGRVRRLAGHPTPSLSWDTVSADTRIRDRLRATRAAYIERQRRWDAQEYPEAAYAAADIAAERVPPPGRTRPATWREHIAEEVQRAVTDDDERNAEEIAEAVVPGLREHAQTREALSAKIAQTPGYSDLLARMSQLNKSTFAEAQRYADAASRKAAAPHITAASLATDRLARRMMRSDSFVAAANRIKPGPAFDARTLLDRQRIDLGSAFDARALLDGPGSILAAGDRVRLASTFAGPARGLSSPGLASALSLVERSSGPMHLARTPRIAPVRPAVTIAPVRTEVTIAPVRTEVTIAPEPSAEIVEVHAMLVEVRAILIEVREMMREGASRSQIDRRWAQLGTLITVFATVDGPAADLLARAADGSTEALQALIQRLPL